MQDLFFLECPIKETKASLRENGVLRHLPPWTGRDPQTAPRGALKLSVSISLPPVLSADWEMLKKSPGRHSITVGVVSPIRHFGTSLLKAASVAAPFRPTILVKCMWLFWAARESERRVGRWQRTAKHSLSHWHYVWKDLVSWQRSGLYWESVRWDAGSLGLSLY